MWNYPDGIEVQEGDMVSVKEAGGSQFHVKGAIGYVEFDGGNLSVRIYAGANDGFGTPASVSVENLEFIQRASS